MPYFSLRGYDCYAVDLPGHEPGQISSVNINYLTIEDYVANVHALVDTLEEQPILVGHSMGGFIVQIYLEKYPCKAAVLLASSPPTGAWRAALRFIRRHPASILNLIKRDITGPFHQYARSELFYQHVPPETMNAYRKKMTAESFTAFLQLLAPSIKFNFHLCIPILVMGAANDRLFDQDDISRTAKRYQTGPVMIDECGHNMMLDTSHETVANNIFNWLKENSL